MTFVKRAVGLGVGGHDLLPEPRGPLLDADFPESDPHTVLSPVALSICRRYSPSEFHELSLTQPSSPGMQELIRHEPPAGAEPQPLYSNGEARGRRGPGAAGGWAAAQGPSRSVQP